MKALNEVAENYFNTLNPIAERISSDIVAIKDAYEGLWNCLSIKERNQIINETVVQPEVVLKYALTAKSCEGISPNIPLITRQVTGGKYIVDDTTGLSWRDEHSAPFSWKTPSQIDLSVFDSSKGEVETKADNTFQIYSKNKESLCSSQFDKSYNGVIDKENNCGKKFEKNENRKSSTTPLSHNVVLVGTCSKLSGLCSKLRFLPGKSYSYEVQTVVTNPNGQHDGSFLDKIKATAVLKLQSLKLVGGKNSTEKKLSDQQKETENLVQPKSAVTIARLPKPSPKIAKPKSPPPPPPVIKATQKDEEKDGNKTNLIFVRNSKSEKTSDEKDPEKAVLLGENSVQSFLSADPDSLEQDAQGKVVHELSDDLNSMSTECTPLSGPIPKSGFDFLDNW